MLYVPEKAGDRAVRVRSGIIQELAEASACRRSLLKLSRFNDWSVTAVAGEILYRLITGMRATVDLHSQGSDEVLECKARGRPLVFVNWHGQNSVNIGIYHPIFGSDARGVIMVHDSPRARIMRHLARRMNIGVIELSSDLSPSRSARAVARMVSLVKGGSDALLAVDGPDGPPYQVKPGAAFIALRSGAVIVPTAAVATRAITLRHRWDKHLVPLPTARVWIHFGPLIDTREGNGTAPSLEELTRRIGEALLESSRQANEMCHAGPRLRVAG